MELWDVEGRECAVREAGHVEQAKNVHKEYDYTTYLEWMKDINYGGPGDEIPDRGRGDNARAIPTGVPGSLDSKGEPTACTIPTSSSARHLRNPSTVRKTGTEGHYCEVHC